MAGECYQYVFSESVDMKEVESTLHLALLSAQSLYGEAATRLDAKFVVHEQGRQCVINADTAVGVDLNKLFLGFLTGEIGRDAFVVHRVGDRSPSIGAAA